MSATPWRLRFRPAHRHHRVAVAALAASAMAFSLLGAVGQTSSAGASHAAPVLPLAAVLHPSAESVDIATSRIATVAADIAEAATPPPPTIFCPVPGSEFIDSWGFARSGGRRHKGVDMMAPHGTPVVAPVAGTVRHSNSRLGGLGFYLVDESGNQFFGSHLQSLGPTGWVEAGTVLGTVGSTGNASPGGPHLHFEVKLARRGTINPYPFAAFWCGLIERDPFPRRPGL